MKKLFFIFNALFLAIILMAHQQLFAQKINESLSEADSHFTYQGKLIHPGLVREFSSWISDAGLPTTISVDIAASHPNEYYEENVRTTPDKRICIDDKSPDGSKNEGYFCYQWLGKLKNGLHVLNTWDNTGGSGVFADLFFVRFNKTEGYTGEGKKYDQLLMSIVRDYALGDRDDGEIKVLSDRVVAEKSKYRKEPLELTFD